MTQPLAPEDGDPGRSASARLAHSPGCPAHGEGRQQQPSVSSCPRCQALEDRIAVLEAEVAALRAGARGGVGRTEPDRAIEETGRETAPSAPPSSGSADTAGLHLPRMDFRALRLMPEGWGAGWGLRPSPARRAWMDEQAHSYQCLPLVLANQWGWQVLCPTDVRATWDGTAGIEGLRIEMDGVYAPAIKSQFGAGILTFSPPWLFRTPSGWDLYLKGPSNRWKANCHPLEGIIETWWLNYTFTINWKLIEPGTVTFARGESIGQLVPVPHATFRDSSALEAPIGLLEPQAAVELLEWYERRRLLIGQDTKVHHLYRKAEGVEEHLHKVEVPDIRSILP